MEPERSAYTLDADRRRLTLGVVGILVVIVLLAVLRSDGSSSVVLDDAIDEPRFEFFEAVIAPLPVEGRGADFDAALVTLPLVNHGRKTTVKAVRPIGDRGVLVQFFGHADCRLGPCAGGLPNSPEYLPAVQRSVVGRLPFRLERDEPRSLVFSLRVTQQGLSAFAERCLVFHAVELTLSDGSRHTARFGAAGTLGGVRRSPTPVGYRDCD